MRPCAYYNEHDPYAAQWLRNLIAAGLIAPGDVDERSIVDVRPADVVGYRQSHFFAGIGGWSYALRLAGWPDDRPVWTGSCPCQPFSSAGKRKGGADDRHLWPHWARLIGECCPPVVFGEQVEAALAHGWLDAVFDDLEGWGYACGAAVLPAASVGAFHIRQRVWFVAKSTEPRWRRRSAQHCEPSQERIGVSPACGEVLSVADASGEGTARHTREDGGARGASGAELHDCGETGGLGYSCCQGSSEQHRERIESEGLTASNFWSDAIWHECRDGKVRPIPIERAFQPLVDGVQPGRVGMLRGAGNAIVPQVAAAFIQAYTECE